MKSPVKYKSMAIYSLAAVLLAASQGLFAHTRLQTPVIDENSAAHGSNYNNEVIGHGCRNPDTGTADIDTIATVAVFPDGIDSSITVNGEPTEQPLTDFVENWGSPVAKIQNKDIFKYEDEIKDTLGNVLGYWSGGTPFLQGGLTGLVPFRTSGVVIKESSCTNSVTFIVSIADICEITPVADFKDSVVMLWTPAVGSNFDGTEDLNGYDSPASLKVMRSLTELPEGCGEGLEVVVTPSATQLNRDMPINYKGSQVWPLNN